MNNITLNIQFNDVDNIQCPISIGDTVGNGIVTAMANYDIFDVLEKIEAAGNLWDIHEAIEEIKEVISKQGVPQNES